MEKDILYWIIAVVSLSHPEPSLLPKNTQETTGRPKEYGRPAHKEDKSLALPRPRTAISPFRTGWSNGGRSPGSRLGRAACSSPQLAPQGGPLSCGHRIFALQLSLGLPGLSCPTWWSPTFRDLGLTHVHPTPHLASICGWHSSGRGGCSNLAGETRGSPGGQQP